MSIKQIIQESVNRNPLGLKEALEEELRGRVALAIEAKMSEMHEDEDEDDMDESFDLSDLTLEELEDFMMSEDFDQLDEISQEKLRNYHAAAGSDRQKAKATVQKTMDMKKPSPSTVNKASDAYKRFQKRGKAMTMAANKMKESFDLSDYTLEELEDFMMSEDFDQLDEISKKTLASYVKKSSDAEEKARDAAREHNKNKPYSQHKTPADFASNPRAANRLTIGGLERRNLARNKMKD
jgi:hypothetical protein